MIQNKTNHLRRNGKITCSPTARTHIQAPFAPHPSFFPSRDRVHSPAARALPAGSAAFLRACESACSSRGKPRGRGANTFQDVHVPLDQLADYRLPGNRAAQGKREDQGKVTRDRRQDKTRSQRAFGVLRINRLEKEVASLCFRLRYSALWRREKAHHASRRSCSKIVSPKHKTPPGSTKTFGALREEARVYLRCFSTTPHDNTPRQHPTDAPLRSRPQAGRTCA